MLSFISKTSITINLSVLLLLAATNSDPLTSTPVIRKQRDGTRANVPSPASAPLYNKYMGGVDQNDQLRTYYHVRLKCRKYYKYIFWLTFVLAVMNSSIICKHYTDPGINDFNIFCFAFAKSLVSDYCSRKGSSRALPQ